MTAFRQCKACGEEFPATPEFFVTIRKKSINWSGLATECRPCRNLRYKPYYEKNRAKLIARAVKSTAAYRATEIGAEKNREWSRNKKRRDLVNPIKRAEHNERGRKWRANNPERAKLFKHEQKSYKTQRVMKRYARKAHASPAWADKAKIDAIYAIAEFLTKHTGIEHQVDHYYPIMGKTSCGLHVHQNLRVITATANLTKGNREPKITRTTAARQ